jgi:hypothetical protein
MRILPRTGGQAAATAAKADQDLFDDALRLLLKSPPVDRSRFETRRTEEERFYSRLIEASQKRAAGAAEPEP